VKEFDSTCKTGLLFFWSCWRRAVWASYSVVGQVVMRRHPQVRVMATTLTLAGLPLVALAPRDFLPRALVWPASVWWAVVFLSLLCTVFGYAVWLNGVRYLGAARVQAFNYLVPFFAVLSGVVLLGSASPGAKSSAARSSWQA